MNNSILLFTLISLICLSCDSQNDDKLYKTQFPKDWVKYADDYYQICHPDSLELDTNFNSLHFILRSKKIGENDFCDNLNVLQMAASYKDDQDMKEQLSNEVYDLLTNAKITNAHKVTSNGREFLKLKGYGDFYDQEMAFEQYFTRIDTLLYGITFTGLKKDEDKYFPLFRDIMTTIVIK